MDMKQLLQKLKETETEIEDLSTKAIITENASGGASSAGGFAPVESSMGMQRRIQKPKKVKAKVKVDEEEIKEEDVLLHPSLNKPKPGFTPKDRVRTDHEVQMATSDLLQCGKNAETIYNILRGVSEDQGIPGWVQEKITKSADYLNTVAEYMEGEYQQYIEQNRLTDSAPRGGYGVVAGGTTMEDGQPIFYGSDKPAQPWAAIDRIAGGKTVTERYARWDGMGFDIRSDHLWPAYAMESKNLFENSNITSWVSDQRENQREPKKGSECVLAIIIYTGKEILVIHGDAQYIGQTPTHYILKNNTGTHQYSKTDQIVFDSQEAFEKFAAMMALKFGDSNINIDIRKQDVMEAYDPRDEGDRWYQVIDGRMKSTMWKHAQEREARMNGWSETQEQALRRAGIMRSKFNANKWIKKDPVTHSWVQVFPYGKPEDSKEVKEASSPAQQAAIAINMKKQGVKPKNKKGVAESDSKPRLNGLSFKQLDKLVESCGVNYDTFDSNIRKNMNLPQWINTMELYAYYANHIVNESKENNKELLSELFQDFNNQCRRCIESAKVGDRVSLLHLQTVNIPGNKIHARLYGFTHPKEIVEIIQKPTFKQLKFSDGKSFPEGDDIFLTDQMQSMNMTKLFGSAEEANRVAMWYALKGDTVSNNIDFRINIDITESIHEGTITEKAKSKKQQQFFGMVRAIQKGKKVKGASKELKAAAKDISKSDVKDFAKTKHKGLPTRVDESIEDIETRLGAKWKQWSKK